MIMELSGEFPVKLLCETMGIQRSSFYSWKKHLSDPSNRTRAFVSNILLFQEYAPIMWNGDQHTDTTRDYGMPCVMPASFAYV